MTEIHEARPEKPIVTRYEPGFRRVYAKGGVVSRDPEPDPMIRLAFWSGRADVKLTDELTGTGYSLEMEVVMSLDGARRVRDLLTFWLDKEEKAADAARAESPPKA